MEQVFFVVENYIPRMSGVPIVVQYLAEGLAQQGYNVTICTRLYKGLPRQEIINGVQVYRFDIRKTMMKRYVGEIDQYRNFILSSHIDVLICECSECSTTDILLKDLHKIKAKKIFHSHGFAGMRLKFLKWNTNLKYTLGNTYNWLRFKWYYNITFKKYIQDFDVALCLSDVDSSKKWLEKNSKKVIVLQNAVNDIFYNSTSNQQIYPAIADLNKNYLLCVATYSKQKNQIDIVKEYFKTKTDYALVFIGPEENEYYHLLKKEISNLEKFYGHRDILTLTHVPRPFIPNIIGNASLYLVGSRFEEYSISLIETMAKGIPFISTNVGNACILPGGITINKISEMHNQIDNLLKDKEKYEQLSRLGKAFVEENCRINKAVKLLSSIIKSEK